MSSPDTPPAGHHRPVAAFDFDGTLARRDTLLGFLVQATSTTRVAMAMARFGCCGACWPVTIPSA
jgi:hypothetical protein